MKKRLYFLRTQLAKTGLCCLLGLLMMSSAFAQATKTYTVRARGTSGTEQIQFKVDNVAKATWTITTALADYNITASVGTVTVEFINDAANRDVVVDYVKVDNTTYQSESQSINTGFYANGRCGGGSNSELLHCNGYIRYAITSTCAGNCPAGFTLFLCGRCWADQAQATSGGCTETCAGGGTTAPTAPSGLAATVASSTQINLTWTDNANNETGYLVERATGTGAFGQVASIAAGSTSYSSTGLTASTGYSFRVRATNSAGNSAYSNTATATTSGTTNTAPAAPTNLAAAATSNTQIDLSWSDNASNETGYLVERATGTGAFGQVASIAAGSTSYSSTGLTAATSYSFRVRATNAVGNSAYSNTATATTTNGTSNSISGKFTPPAGKTLMIIGQDLGSVTDYVNSGQFPTPSGVTTYVSFYDVLNAAGRNGALGIDNSGTPQGASLDLDWGGGPLNSYSAVAAWPNSTLQMGLNISEYANSQGFLAQLANGQKDAEINQLAVFFKKVATVSKKPIYLRIGYEFDGTWNAGYQNQANFKGAFQRIVTVLRNQGVTNVAYVWQACASPIDDIIEGVREDINGWYPGDTFVDWVALSWFLLPNETPPVGGNPASQLALANEVVSFGRTHNKPVMIAESTPQGYNTTALNNANISTVWDGASGANVVSKTAAQIWSEWFTPFFNFIRTNSDAIRAVSYINANWNAQGLWDAPYEQGYWGDTRVQANATITTNWKNELATPLWLHGSATLFGQLGVPGAPTARLATTEATNAKEEVSLSFYPNPNSTGKLKSTGLKSGMHYSVIDNKGALCSHKLVDTDDETIDVSSFASGIYNILVISQGKQIVQRVIIEQ
jgi:hypothetical protein